MSAHGYGRYTNGCRCDVCRAAKAAYMRAQRTRVADEINALGGYVNELGRYVAPISKHGTLHGYQNHGCRCDDCTAAKAVAGRRQYQAKRGAA